MRTSPSIAPLGQIKTPTSCWMTSAAPRASVALGTN